MNNSEDSIYTKPQVNIVDFEFDEDVARVFPDMIRRSVPGYGTIISLSGLIAEQYAQAGSNIYDLGCSQGAVTLAMRHRIQHGDCKIIAVDNAQAMIEHCRQNIDDDISIIPVDIVCDDICNIEIKQASVVALNFTLQFINPDARIELLKTIYNGLLPGGALLLSEKISFDNNEEKTLQNKLHLEFKRANGYSDLEISQKRTALENVLVPETIKQHQQRLTTAGFSSSHTWFQCFNFASLLAIK